MKSNRKFQFGKQPARHDPRTLQFVNYSSARLDVPASVPHTTAAKDWPLYQNNKYGTCSCAAAAHMIINWTALSGRVVTPKEKDVLTVYRHFTTPGRDKGAVMLDVLRYWRKQGLGGDKISVFTQLEPRSAVEVKQAIHYFGAAYIGFMLPKFLLKHHDASQISWAEHPHGLSGDGAPDANFGHCVCGIGYDAHKIYVVSWGKIKTMTWQFYKDYMDEAYVALSPDLLKNGRSPAGFDTKQLLADLETIHKTKAPDV